MAEIDIVPFPAPTLTIPIPETARTVLYVPEEVAPVVFPEAESELVIKLNTESVRAAMVIVLFDAPILTIPDADRLKLLPIVTLVPPSGIVCPIMLPVIVE